MLNIKIPEFDYHFFDPSKSNAAIAKINYHECEITPMIYDYLDYHSDKLGIKEIIDLLESLRSYCFALELLEENNITQERFLEIESKLIGEFNTLNQCISDTNLQSKDKILLNDAKDYVKKVITNKMNRLNLNEEKNKFLNASALATQLSVI